MAFEISKTQFVIFNAIDNFLEIFRPSLLFDSHAQDRNDCKETFSTFCLACNSLKDGLNLRYNLLLKYERSRGMPLLISEEMHSGIKEAGREAFSAISW